MCIFINLVSNLTIYRGIFVLFGKTDLESDWVVKVPWGYLTNVHIQALVPTRDDVLKLLVFCLICSKATLQCLFLHQADKYVSHSVSYFSDQVHSYGHEGKLTKALRPQEGMFSFNKLGCSLCQSQHLNSTTSDWREHSVCWRVVQLLLLKTEVIPQCIQRLCHFFAPSSAAQEPIIDERVDELCETDCCLPHTVQGYQGHLNCLQDGYHVEVLESSFSLETPHSSKDTVTWRWGSSAQHRTSDLCVVTSNYSLTWVSLLHSFC